MSELKTIIKEHITYRNQIWKLAKSDLVKTYRGSALGWLWAIVKPTVTILVYWFAFSTGLRITSQISEHPFFLWLIAGIVPWFYINEMLTQGTDCIRKYSYLVTKMKFPVSVIPTFVNISKIVVNLALVAIVILIFILMGYPPTIYMLQLPFYIILMFIFLNAWSLFASFIAAISKDFSNLVKSFMTALFWLSGILWNVNNISIPWLQKLLMINPVTYIVNGFRNSFLEQKWFFEQPLELLFFLGILTIMILLGLWSYKKLRKEIPDVL